MKIKPSVFSVAAAATLALAALGMTGAAQARDVYWSVGVSSPGVHVGVNSAPPVVIHQPAYVQSSPVYVVPRPVVHVQPAPIYVAGPQYVQADWERPEYGRRWQHGRGHHEWDRNRGPGRGHDRD